MCAWWGGPGGGGWGDGGGWGSGVGRGGGRSHGGGGGRGNSHGHGRGNNGHDWHRDSSTTSKAAAKPTSKAKPPTTTSKNAAAPTQAKQSHDSGDGKRGGQQQGQAGQASQGQDPTEGTPTVSFVKDKGAPTSGPDGAENPASRTAGSGASPTGSDSTHVPIAAQSDRGTASPPNPTATNSGSLSGAGSDPDALKGSTESSAGQKAGIALGIIAGIALVLLLIFIYFKYRRGSRPLKSLSSRFRGGGASEQAPPIGDTSVATSPVSEKPLISPMVAAFPAPGRRNTEPMPRAQPPPPHGDRLAPISASGRPHAAAAAAAHRRTSVSSLGASSIASSAAMSPSTMSWPMPPQTPVQSMTAGSNNTRSGAGTAASSVMAGRSNNSSGASSPRWITFHEPATTVVRVECRRPARPRRDG